MLNATSASDTMEQNQKCTLLFNIRKPNAVKMLCHLYVIYYNKLVQLDFSIIVNLKVMVELLISNDIWISKEKKAKK